jgi:hypothetical protein
MAQTCNKCSRINPTEASYCYYDGSALIDHLANGGSFKTGSQPFPRQFVYPSGKVCVNFDQLAVACQENWAETRELLQQGFLEAFLGGLGRTDLAAAARDAAQHPDPDRGLDQLLNKLPTEVVREPKLAVEPSVINLGQLSNRDDRQLELHLYNQGMRLLYGSVSCEDAAWLALGDAPGSPRKVFQFGSELVMPVQIRGKMLRASSKPQEGRLFIDSNGGRMTVVVRVEVSPQSFPEGVLGGALSPRQLAGKAKARPKEAAVFFENGEVAKWYQTNGWIYPVRGPVASGLGAVQQFFEALGLSPAPKIEVSPGAISLRGRVGQPVDYSLRILTQEKRPVYASATSNQPWLIAGRVRLEGRQATLPLSVSRIPETEDDCLQAEVTVTANGNQRFVIPFKVEIDNAFEFGQEEATTVEEKVSPVSNDFRFDPWGGDQESTSVEAERLPSSSHGSEDLAHEKQRSKRPKFRMPAWNLRHLIQGLPAAGLGLVLLLILVLDLWLGPTAIQRKEGRTRIGDRHAASEPVIAVNFLPERRRFGIQMLKEPDPNDPEKLKRLTLDAAGATNNTCVRIGTDESLFGQRPGTWASEKGRRLDLVEEIKGQRWKSVMDYREGIRVTRTVAIFPNEQTLKLDTCLVHFSVENRSDSPQEVGVRFMLDAFIGDNHAVPFRMPGSPDLLNTKGDFSKDQVPDSIQALERPDLQDPGAVAHLGLKLPGFKLNPTDPDLDPLERLVLCRWQDSDVRWDWDFKPINDGPQDRSSCVVLYWPVKSMDPGSQRTMAFTYGLGRVTSLKSGGMELSLDHPPVRPGQTFVVTVRIPDAPPGQPTFLHLPENGGFSLSEGEERGQISTAKGQATWKVRAGEAGSYHLVVTSGLARADLDLEVRKPSSFR